MDTTTKQVRARDILERLLWTFVAATLTNIVGVSLVGIDVWQAAVLAGVNSLLTYALTVARWRLSILPNPGQALADHNALAGVGVGYEAALKDVKEVAPAALEVKVEPEAGEAAAALLGNIGAVAEPVKKAAPKKAAAKKRAPAKKAAPKPPQ